MCQENQSIGEDKENLYQNHNMKIPNKPCKCAKFRYEYLAMALKKLKLQA